MLGQFGIPKFSIKKYAEFLHVSALLLVKKKTNKTKTVGVIC